MIIPKGTVVTIDGKVYRTLEAQVAWNKEELESLDIESLEALPDQFTELQENVSALSDSVADVAEDVGDIKSDVTDAEADISNLKGRMTSAERNISSNAQSIGQLEFDVDQVEGDITALGNSKLNKPTNEGDTGDVIVKTANGTEYQSVAPFNPNGTYPNVTAGKSISAKSLENVSEDSGATQTAPFFFQETATANGTEETPTAPVFELKSIRGNTIVYNQLVDGVTRAYPTISGHVYWFKHDPLVSLVTSTGTDINVPTPQSDKLVDLTRWFNGSIPQAILDDPTVFPINYYDGELTYSAGELKNCSCTEFKTVGFNQWDEEWEVGGYDTTTGNPEPYTDRIRSKNPIEVFPNTSYYAKDPTNGNNIRILFYDASLSYINATSFTMGVFTTPSNCRYIKFFTSATYGNVYKNDICINLHWDGERDGTYEPFTSHTYPLVWSGKSAGDAYDERLPDGTEITRIQNAKFSDFTWSLVTDATMGNFFRGISSTLPQTVAPGYSVCSKYSERLNPYGISTDKIYFIFYQQNQVVFLVRDTAYSTLSEFTTATANEEVNYEATPTTSEGTPYTSEIEGDDYGTMSFDSVVPVGNEFFYPADYSLLIDDLGNYTGYDVTKLAKKTDLIPAPTGSDGTYVFKATISGGTVTYFWEAVS